MITVQNLCKTYKVAKRKAGMREACRSLFRREYEEIHALDQISFQIEDGETIGYIGPNGAGKSTSIKVLSGILTPDEGTCVVNGKIPWKDRISYVKDIGVVFGQRSQLWWDVPVIDSFELLRDIYSIPQAMYKNNLEELTELLNLSELLKTPARQLSLGQRMRCERHRYFTVQAFFSWMNQRLDLMPCLNLPCVILLSSSIKSTKQQ